MINRTALTNSHYANEKMALFFMVAFALVLALPGHSPAQTFRGTILGTVTDPNGAVVPDASITARNMSTGLERSTVTDSAGNYTVPELPIGIYQLVVQKSGFEPFAVNNVIVEVSGERRADVSLAVQGTTNQVTILSGNQVETTSTTLGGTINTKQVADLPINGRDFTKFITFVPGVT
ncbi:MAG: carboxypeptidase-like regulatory domain-containing protein, partial [Pyrinomonadaceae bacterium]